MLKQKIQGNYVTRRITKGKPTLSVPKEKTKKFCETRGYGRWETTKATHRSELILLSDMEIISTYNAELRGIANYYAMAKNVKTRLNKLFYIAHSSLIKTLARKHKAKATAIYSKLRLNNSLGIRYEVKGKTKLLKVFKLSELKPVPKRHNDVDKIPQTFIYNRGTELLRRWNAQECEICKKDEGHFEIHHIRKLKDIKDGKEKWQKLMIARRRKTLVLCVECHDLLHSGKLPDQRFKDYKRESVVQ